MSHDATNWAVKVRGISASEARVLWHLADCHNPVLGCFPSQEYLAEASEMDIRSVRRILAGLRDKGLCAWEEQRAGNRRDNNRYRLAFEADFQPDKLSGSEQASTGQIASPEPDKNDGLNRTLESAEPVIEPVREPERESARDAGSQSGVGPKGIPDPDLLVTLKRMHPGSAQEDPDIVAVLWAGLSAAERRAAVDRHGDWMEDGRKARRTVVPKLAFYLGKKLWTGLPEKAAGKAGAGEAARPAIIGAFDRAWWWLFFDWIVRHIATIGDRDSAAARELRKRIELALGAAAIGWQVPRDTVEAVEAGALGMAKAHVSGGEFTAWRRHLATELGVELPRPDRTEWVYLPAQWPDGWPGADETETTAMRQHEVTG